MADTFQLSFGGLPFREVGPDQAAAIQSWLRAQDLPVLVEGDFAGPNLRALDPDPPEDTGPIKYNELFYPAGVSRWCVFQGFMHADDVTALKASALDPTGGALPLTFVMKDGSGNPGVSTPLYLHQAKPLTGLAGAADLYLITLVDERWWFRWKTFDPWTNINTFADWYSFITGLAANLGITLNGLTFTESLYGQPEIDSGLFEHYENPAHLLDIALANVGRVATRKLDGTYDVVTYAQANTYSSAAHAALAPHRAAGGSLFADIGTADRLRGPVMPAAVVVTFPRWTTANGYDNEFSGPYPYRGRELARSYGAVYAKTLLPSGLGVPYNTIEAQLNTTAALHTTAKAIELDQGGTPTNQAQLDTLATQLAKDYYDSLHGNLAEAYHGVVEFDHRAALDVIYRYMPDPVTLAWSNDPNRSRTEFQHGFGGKYGGFNAVLKLQDTTWYDPLYPTGTYVYPARVQKWVSAVGQIGSWQDANNQNVGVQDPNFALGAKFRPGEYCYAKYVENNLFERIGLPGLHVTGTGAVSEFNSQSYATVQGGYAGVRHLHFNFPMYLDDPQGHSGSGTGHVWIFPSSATTEGVLLGYPGFNAPPYPGYQGYDGSDPYRKQSIFQWARGGWTGFSGLMSNVLEISGDMPVGGGFPSSILPPDTDFLGWGGSGNATLSWGSDYLGGASGGAFVVGVSGSPSLKWSSNGTVNWGDSSNYGRFKRHNFWTDSFGIGISVTASGYCQIAKNLEVNAVPFSTVNSQYGGLEPYGPNGPFLYVGRPRVFPGGNVATPTDVGIGNAGGSLGFTIHSNGYGMVSEAVLSASGGVFLGPDTTLGVNEACDTFMKATNIVFPTGYPFGGAPGGALAGPAGYIFWNGIYLGGLEGLTGIRPGPGQPPGGGWPPVAPPGIWLGPGRWANLILGNH